MRPADSLGVGGDCDQCELSGSSMPCQHVLPGIADAKGYAYTVLYVQACAGVRPVFATLGIPLLPGEMGKEWVGGEFISYACPAGQNL